MPLASRIISPTIVEPKTKKAKTVVTKKRNSGRQAAIKAAEANGNTSTTSSQENDDNNTDKENVENGKSNDMELQSDLNDTINDTIMTENKNAATTSAAAAEEVVIFENTKTLAEAGFVLSVGENLSNQLGLTLDVDGRKKPQLIKLLPKQGDFVMVCSGGMHSCVLTKDGEVFTFGCNDEFALGRGNEDEIEPVVLPEKIIEISAGDSHCAALSETGIVYAWGTFRDGSGVVGIGMDKKIAKVPLTFTIPEKVVKISSGADHLVFLTVSGDVYTAGNSEHGQLGRISKYNCFRGGRRGAEMILVPGLVRVAKRKELGTNKKVDDIWTSSYCTYLKIKNTDYIVAFGLNNCYQLGGADMENRYQPELMLNLKFLAPLKKIIGGMHHTLFLDTNGRVYSMGSHRYGGLGLGQVEAEVGFPTLIPNLLDIIDIAADTNTSYAVNKDGKAFSWGTNYSKQLGQDDEEDYYDPTLVKSKQLDCRKVRQISIGGQHSLFIVSDEIEVDSDSD